MKETLNLLPTGIEAAAPKQRGKYFYLFWGLAGYSILMMVLWIFKNSEIKRLDSEINRLTKHKTELQQKVQPPLPPVPNAVPIDKDIVRAMEKTPKWSLIVSDISVIVPENVWLSSVESRDDKGIKQVNIKGFSTTQFGVANLISALEGLRYLYDIEIVFAQKGEKDISFELKTKLRWT